MHRYMAGNGKYSNVYAQAGHNRLQDMHRDNFNDFSLKIVYNIPAYIRQKKLCNWRRAL